MADYESALNTSLGDYLSYRASQDETTREELEKKLAIEPIRVEGGAVFGNPSNAAVKRFDEIAQAYDVVVELREGISEIGWFGAFVSSYRISGTGIREK